MEKELSGLFFHILRLPLCKVQLSTEIENRENCLARQDNSAYMRY